MLTAKGAVDWAFCSRNFADELSRWIPNPNRLRRSAKEVASSVNTHSIRKSPVFSRFDPSEFNRLANPSIS